MKKCLWLLDYSLGHHANTLFWIVPKFFEPYNDDVPTYKERHSHDSDIELEDEEHHDTGSTNDDVDDYVTDDDMTKT